MTQIDARRASTGESPEAETDDEYEDIVRALSSSSTPINLSSTNLPLPPPPSRMFFTLSSTNSSSYFSSPTALPNDEINVPSLFSFSNHLSPSSTNLHNQYFSMFSSSCSTPNSPTPLPKPSSFFDNSVKISMSSNLTLRAILDNTPDPSALEANRQLQHKALSLSSDPTPSQLKIAQNQIPPSPTLKQTGWEAIYSPTSLFQVPPPPLPPPPLSQTSLSHFNQVDRIMFSRPASAPPLSQTLQNFSLVKDCALAIAGLGSSSFLVDHKHGKLRLRGGRSNQLFKINSFVSTIKTFGTTAIRLNR